MKPIMKSFINDPLNILQRIHKYVVYNCAELWGWLFNFSVDNIGQTELPCSYDEAVSVLTAELSVSFVQRDISLINVLLDYLKALHGKDYAGKTEILSTFYFQWIWEAVCGYIFDNNYNQFKAFVPMPKWFSSRFSGRIEQRPDILFYHERVLYILDAKYYNFHESVPGWHDTVKQFFYRYTILNNIKKAEKIIGSPVGSIKNIFIFPGQEERDLEFIGYVSIPEVPSLDKIYSYVINTKKALEAYSEQSQTLFKQLLVNDLKTDPAVNGINRSESYNRKKASVFYQYDVEELRAADESEPYYYFEQTYR